MPRDRSIGELKAQILDMQMDIDILKETIGILNIHSDRGCHYRWPERISINEKGSMSEKGCSHDNAAHEDLLVNFFGFCQAKALDKGTAIDIECRCDG